MLSQLVFEDMGFRSYAAVPAPALAVRQWVDADGTDNPAARAMAGVVLDAGFSFTHAAPVFDGRVLPSGVRRINLGGKALTNYLKELVSYRWASLFREGHSQAQPGEVLQDWPYAAVMTTLGINHSVRTKFTHALTVFGLAFANSRPDEVGNMPWARRAGV